MNLPKWVAKVTTTWVAIGALLVILGQSGLDLPSWIFELFTQSFVDTTLGVVEKVIGSVQEVIGIVIGYYQFVRAIFNKEKEGEIQTLSVAAKRKFALNPFKLGLAA